jgi:hypothetical protein
VDRTGQSGLSRPLKAGIAALTLAGLLAIVALAARGGHPDTHGRVRQREVPTWVINDLLTIIVMAYGLGVVVVIVAFFVVRRKYWEEPPTHRRLVRNLILASVLLVAIALLGNRNLFPRHPEGLKHPPLQGERSGDGRSSPTSALPATERRAEFDWVLAAIVGGGLVLLAVWVLVRRRGDEGVAEETVEEELSAVVSDTIDDLRRETDPRRAVIAAYARMERVLGQHGQPRRPSEAPFEFVARILLALRVRAGAVRELTELFERAKFSTHEIDDPMKERAIAALVSVRDDLQSATA